MGYESIDKRMTRRNFLKGLAAGSVAVLSPFVLLAGARDDKHKRPNILLLMCDDMGWCDLSCFGNDRVQTPNVDRLAVEGLRMTQFYAAAAICTPTRASVLTGRYPLRFDIDAHFTDQGEFLPRCPTLPMLLKQAGYATGHVGKWHLGGVRVKDTQMRDRVPGPREHGFDRYLTQIEEQPLRGTLGRERTLYRKGGTCLLRDEQPVRADDPYYDMYWTDIIGEHTTKLIRQFHGQGKPFFLNVWWLAPHTPYEPAPEPHWSQTAAEGISEDQHRFRSMVVRMDYQVGRILRTLDDLGIADNTLVLFVSDNGGAYEANIGPLKGGKTDLHEGGIRVPFIARWPRRIKPGMESRELGHTNDLLPTCCAVAGTPLPDDHQCDGLNLLPLLTGRADRLERGMMFWRVKLYKHLQRHYPKPKPYATEVARRGRWKLLAFNGEPVELIDMEADLVEQRNLLEERPDVAQSLHRELTTWLDEPRQPFEKID